MTKRETYDSLVSEIEADLTKIELLIPTSYSEMVASNSSRMALPEEGVFLKTPTSAFADYSVRDRLMVKAMESEEFAFVLTNKIANTVETKWDSNTISQEDVEALACAGQVVAMWEQFALAEAFVSTIATCVSKYDLNKPSLTSITEAMLSVRDTFPFDETRQSVVADLSNDLEGALD